MKHLALGVGILVLLFGLGLWSHTMVYHFTEEIAQTLEQGEAEKAREQWDSHYGFLASWLEHQSLDKIEEGFHEIKSPDDCRKLAEMVRGLQDEDSLTYYNVLSCNVYKNQTERLAG